MSENQLLVLNDAQALVTELLSNKLSKGILFHTLQHTQEVVAAAKKLAELHELSDDDHFAVVMAAWFHDTGYTSGDSKDHETVSKELALEFLNTKSISDEIKNKILNCIEATRMPQSPNTTIERILCDADLFHLSTESFHERSRKLREEILEFGGKDVSKKDWRNINIRFLEGHKYFTNYGKEKLEPLKEVHLAELKLKANKTEDMKPAKKEKDKDKSKVEQVAAKAAADKAKKEKEKQSERGIATVFRIVAQNQNNLSWRINFQ